jgi:hypothetical protein
MAYQSPVQNFAMVPATDVLENYEILDPSAEPPLVAVSSGSAAEREATPAEIGTSLSIDVPEGYGRWDWEDDDAHRHLEMQMAEDFSMPWHTRGPPSPLNGGPLLWKHMPWNSEKKCWGYWCEGSVAAHDGIGSIDSHGSVAAHDGIGSPDDPDSVATSQDSLMSQESDGPETLSQKRSWRRMILEEEGETEEVVANKRQVMLSAMTGGQDAASEILEDKARLTQRVLHIVRNPAGNSLRDGTGSVAAKDGIGSQDGQGSVAVQDCIGSIDGQGSVQAQDGIRSQDGQGTVATKDGIGSQDGQGSVAAQDGIGAIDGQGSVAAKDGIGWEDGKGSVEAEDGIGSIDSQGSVAAQDDIGPEDGHCSVEASDLTIPYLLNSPWYGQAEDSEDEVYDYDFYRHPDGTPVPIHLAPFMSGAEVDALVTSMRREIANIRVSFEL